MHHTTSRGATLRLSVSSLGAFVVLVAFVVPVLPAAELDVAPLLTDSRTISRFETPISPAQVGEIRISSAVGAIWLVSASGRLARYSAESAVLEQQWPLPPVLKAVQAGSLALAAVGHDTVWVVDRDGGSMQLFDHGVWHGPFIAGDRIGGVAARRDRRKELGGSQRVAEKIHTS